MLLSPVVNCRVTQKFGERPEVYKQFGLKGHNGIDFAGAKVGQKVPIRAPMEGYLQIGDQGTKGYGKFVKIFTRQLDQKERTKEVTLGHFDSIHKKWKNGDFVPLGEELGIMGDTGFSNGVHLHMGLRFLNKNGYVIDANNGYSGAIDFFNWIIW